MLRQPRRDVAIEARHATSWPAVLARLPLARMRHDSFVFVTVAAAYFAVGMASIALIATPENVVSVWPAAGIAVGALLMLGRGARWPVAAAVFAANMAASAYLGKPWATTLVFAGANTLECVLVAWLTERFAGTPFNLNTLSRVLIFLGAALLGALLAAIPASLAIQYFATSTSRVFDVWSLWVRSDFVGIITVAPVLVGLGMAMKEPPSRLEVVEGLFLLLLLGGAVVYLLTLPPHGGPWTASVSSGLMFPFLLAVAARCRPLFPAAGSFLIATVVIATANLGVGRFGAGIFSPEDRIIAAQTAMTVVALCSLSLAALFARGHEAEDALRKSEEQLRVSLIAGKLGHWEYDFARREVTGSDIAYAVFGGMPRPRMGYDEVVSAVHRDDRARLEAAIAQAIERTDELDLECRTFWPDRTVHWVHMVGRVARDRNGKPIRMHGTSRDITQRKVVESALRESETRQRLALDATDLGTWRHDLDTETTTFDARALQHAGVGAAADWRQYSDRLHPDDRDEARRALQAAIDPAGHGGQTSREFRVRMPDGGWRWLRINALATFTGTGAGRQAVTVVGTTQDVTEQKRSEERLRLLVRELDHRVKNMLTVIEVLIDRSRESEPSPDALVAGIRARIGAMGRVHDRLCRAQWSGVDLEMIIEDELAAYRTVRNVRLDGPSIRLSPDAALTLTMTLHELATNAAKHGSLSVADGRVAVSWRIVPTDGETDILALSWQEEGGPPVPSSPARVGLGTGIIRGLVVHELGGSVDLRLEPGGVRCDLRMPAAKVLADAGAANTVEHARADDRDRHGACLHSPAAPITETA